MKMIDKTLYDWLKYQWRISNHNKYQHYFKTWVANLTDAQVFGFNKMKEKENIYG